jgi:hypothetical protein
MIAVIASRSKTNFCKLSASCLAQQRNLDEIDEVVCKPRPPHLEQGCIAKLVKGLCSL